MNDCLPLAGELRFELPNLVNSGPWVCLFSPDDNIVFLGHYNGYIIRWKLDDKTHTMFLGHMREVYALALNADGERLVHFLFILIRPTCVSLSGSVLFSGGNCRTVQARDAKEFKMHWTISCENDVV